MKKFLSSAFLFFSFVMLLNAPCFSAQHEIVQKLIEHSKQCYPLYYFTPEQIASKDKQEIFLLGLVDSAALKEPHAWEKEVKDLNLLPVNKCVYRGNKNYYKEKNKVLLSALEVKQIINTDFVAHTLVDGKTFGYKYTFVPIYPNGYPKGESIVSLLNAFNNILQATPQQRVYISCFDGKHRSSLISSILQFIGEYAANPAQACLGPGTENDKGFVEAKALADQGLFTYNMPAGYKQFYLDFTQSVCNNDSEKFLNGLN
jgi:hypothetical protein